MGGIFKETNKGRECTSRGETNITWGKYLRRQTRGESVSQEGETNITWGKYLRRQKKGKSVSQEGNENSSRGEKDKGDECDLRGELVCHMS